MVNWIGHALASGAWLLAQQPPQSALQRMSPDQRARVLAALTGLVILGFGLVALAWLGARVTRRYMSPRPLRPPRDSAEIQDDWSTKPLCPPEQKPARRDAAPPE